MKRFVFLDFETTGLDEQLCAPIELAVVVTDEQINELVSSEVLILPRPGCIWEEPAREMHRQSGLLEAATDHGHSLLYVQHALPAALMPFAGADVTLHLAGSSVHFDRRFLRRYFPDVERMLHHRHLDVSAVRMLAESAGHPPRTGNKPHRAMADVRASLEDARHFLGVLRW